MAFFSLGNGCHQTRDSKSLEWAKVYLSGHQLLHQVGGGHLLQSVTQVVVARFLKQKIICCYGVQRKLITDNGKKLNGKMIEQLYQQFKIEHQNSISYRP